MSKSFLSFPKNISHHSEAYYTVYVNPQQKKKHKARKAKKEGRRESEK